MHSKLSPAQQKLGGRARALLAAVARQNKSCIVRELLKLYRVSAAMDGVKGLSRAACAAALFTAARFAVQSGQLRPWPCLKLAAAAQRLPLLSRL